MTVTLLQNTAGRTAPPAFRAIVHGLVGALNENDLNPVVETEVLLDAGWRFDDIDDDAERATFTRERDGFRFVLKATAAAHDATPAIYGVSVIWPTDAGLEMSGTAWDVLGDAAEASVLIALARPEAFAVGILHRAVWPMTEPFARAMAKAVKRELARTAANEAAEAIGKRLGWRWDPTEGRGFIASVGGFLGSAAVNANVYPAGGDLFLNGLTADQLNAVVNALARLRLPETAG